MSFSDLEIKRKNGREFLNSILSMNFKTYEQQVYYLSRAKNQLHKAQLCEEEIKSLIQSLNSFRCICCWRQVPEVTQKPRWCEKCTEAMFDESWTKCFNTSVNKRLRKPPAV